MLLYASLRGKKQREAIGEKAPRTATTGGRTYVT